MLTTRPANERGHANHGWLDSYHTFSFGSYYDPKHMGVSALRVINEDSVRPGAGFPTHGHSDMEIISYVKQGSIAHRDSIGNVQLLPAGEFQLMTAGTGITHSEYNPSSSDPLKLLQIWIQPNEYGIEPGYQQKRFGTGPMQLIASPDGDNGSLQLHQDARLYHATLTEGESSTLGGLKGRTLYLHVIGGTIEVEARTLHEGDGATLTSLDTLVIHSASGGEALLFDLP